MLVALKKNPHDWFISSISCHVADQKLHLCIHFGIKVLFSIVH